MSYSSQKSCVKIWFGLVEIVGMLMPSFELGWGFLDKNHVWKFGTDWLGLSRVIMGTKEKKKKKTSKAAWLWCSRRGYDNNWKHLSKSEVSDFSGGQKPPIRESYNNRKSWNYENLPYLVANTCGLNVIKIGGIWIFRGGRNPLLGGLYAACDAYFQTWPSHSSQKSYVKIWFGLVEPFKSYHVHKHFSGGRAGIPY